VSIGVSGSASADPRIAALDATDFTVRARAGEALVAEGEAALSTLGVAADGERARHASPSRVAPVIASILRAAPAPRLTTVHLVASSPAVRAAAATEVAARDRWEDVPALIERVGDDDLHVRAAAVAALRRVARRCYDVDLHLAPAQATAVVERERTWWRREGSLGRRARAAGG
jgi:hypothetical protein